MASEVVNSCQSSLVGFGASHPGQAREKNEDAFFCDPERGVFGVIDGMGGHAAGELAARIARDVIAASLRDLKGDAETRVREAIANANNEIYRQAQENLKWNSMACVLTLALVEGTNVTIGHVGDTRLYRLRHGEIERLTRDHSLVGDLEEQCIVTELEAMHHPRRNEVFRDVGTEERTPYDRNFIDVFGFDLKTGDDLLLCSDGLSDMLTARQILEVAELNKSNPKEIVHQLIRAANRAGGKDNVTVLYMTRRGGDADVTRDSIKKTDYQEAQMATLYKRASDRERRPRWVLILSSRWSESFGLALASSVVIFGLFLVYQAKTTNPERTPFSQVGEQLKSKELINLNKATTNELMPALTAFEDDTDRKFVADKIAEFVALNKRSLENVGSLSRINVERKEIDNSANLVVFRDRLNKIREEEKLNPPEKPEQPVRLLADFSQFKPLFIVRTPAEFESEFVLWCAAFIFTFYAIHILWRVRSFKGNPLLLPIVHLLSGLGLILMTTLRDPLRDSLSFKDFALGVMLGGAILYSATLIDFQRLTSKLIWKPLIAAVGLSVLLLVFGKGPGASDAKVNLWIFQPAEFIKIFLVFFLAGYFAENWEYLRELRQKGQGVLALLRRLNAPRLAEIAPVTIAMGASLTFFFLQKDLGPALIMGLTFVVLYGAARHRFKAALLGLGILAAGIWIGYKAATPLLVYQRIRIWLDIWDNGLRNGDQIAHAWWALAMGRYTGTGLGLGSPSLIPAGHTDLILASAGEELGFIGVAICLILYVLLIATCLRIALRSQSDYAFFVVLGLTLITVFEILLITGGVLGLIPLSGVVSPFLSFGKSSMVANCAIIGIILSLSASTQRKESHRQRFGFPVKIISLAFCVAAFALVGRAAYIQVWKSDHNAIAPVLTRQRDNQYRYVYNPRLADALKLLPQGTIFDRNGIPLATSDWEELEKHRYDFENLGINIDVVCKKEDKRFYPFGLSLFHFLGDTRTKENWSASNSAYLERDYAWRLRGFNDRVEKIQKTVLEIDQTTKQLIPRDVEVIRHDYNDVLPLLRYRNRPDESEYQELVQRERYVNTSVDARLQLKATDALNRQLRTQNLQKGAAVFIDASTGEVLAIVSLPVPTATPKPRVTTDLSDSERMEDTRDRFLNRALYGLYPPGSTFKIVTAIAALRKDPTLVTVKHECRTLGDGRVGNYVKGWGRPVRDAEGDRAHGAISMEEGIVVSCNAFFGQFATYDISAIELWRTSNFFEITVARPNTAQMLTDDLPWSAFGQGRVLATPFEMARVAATIANSGVMPYGRWVTDASNQRTKQGQAILNRQESAIIARAMRGVVQRGTATNLSSITPPISGKTGTAEVENRASHSWFIGFAPLDNSRSVAFAIVVENGGFGNASAAQVAGEVVRAMTRY